MNSLSPRIEQPHYSYICLNVQTKFRLQWSNLQFHMLQGSRDCYSNLKLVIYRYLFRVVLQTRGPGSIWYHMVKAILTGESKVSLNWYDQMTDLSPQEATSRPCDWLMPVLWVLQTFYPWRWYPSPCPMLKLEGQCVLAFSFDDSP